MKLLLLDSNSLINRAYYALPNMRDSSGRCTGGVYGFVNMLARLIAEEKPTHIACAFDVHAPTFRHKQYGEYKAGRHAMPEELVEQMPLLKSVLDAMGIARVELAGYEADDILGTLSKRADMPSIIVSGDKDVLQLVSDKTTVYHTKRGITDVVAYTPARLLEEGIEPWQVPELKGLMGDNSDNIKGVQGVGELTARKLLASYRGIDNLYEHIDELKGKLKENLVAGKESAYFSRELATIYCEVPLVQTIDDLAFDSNLPMEAQQVLRGLDFGKLVDRFSYREVASVASAIAFESVEINDMAGLAAMQETIAKATRVALVYNDCWHIGVDSGEYVLQEGDLLSDLRAENIEEYVFELLVDNEKQKLVYDLKSLMHRFSTDKLLADDVMLLAYSLDAGKTWPSACELVQSKGYSASYVACAMLQVADFLLVALQETGSERVYTDIELPLVGVLYRMETQGFTVDVDTLRSMGEKYTAELANMSKAIYDYAGEPFNVNSPKQLAVVLFDKLGLPTDKKRSTSVDKLERLAPMHPIIPLIMRYRKLSKLNSTYVEGMLPLLDGNNRLHTTFKQAETATGRLSSTEPNLQNIPVRTEDGREIRRAFIASKGCNLVVADYSQIELRIMAHYSQDENMLAAYADGLDIHTATAARVYGVSIDNVTPDMRRSCKAVNFGIIYGISDFGLSESIGCSIPEAKGFIDKYFEMYPGVQAYMKRVVEEAKKDGYVSTLSGRIRSIPELKSSVYTVRAFGERVAMNMPLQGTASDIIKIAMLRVDKRLADEGLQAKMILQVHDELIIDTPLCEIDRVKDILSCEMQNAMVLTAPLIAEVGVGTNWVEAK